MWPQPCRYTIWQTVSLCKTGKRHSVLLVGTAPLQGAGHTAWQAEHWLDFSPYSPVPAENNLCNCVQWPEGYHPSPPGNPHTARANVKVESRSEMVKRLLCAPTPLRVCFCTAGHVSLRACVCVHVRARTNLNGSKHVSTRVSES